MTNANSLQIRGATLKDFNEIWPIFLEVLKTGNSYYYRPDIDVDEARDFWFTDDRKTYVALLNNKIVGAYFIRPHQPGLGSHVANAAYIVDSAHRNLGIGKTIAEHSIEEAKQQGYVAMQFIFVVSTNISAVSLWKKMGFHIVGTSPKSFNHAKLGYVDTYIMHRFLN